LRIQQVSCFALRHSFVIRHLSFGLVTLSRRPPPRHSGLFTTADEREDFARAARTKAVQATQVDVVEVVLFHLKSGLNGFVWVRFNAWLGLPKTRF
jgi:hypothetical protein